MQIWLSNGNKDKLLIPVNPPEIGTNDTRNFEDIVLANGDEKTVISGRNLKTYTLSSFFPRYDGTLRHSKRPKDYVNKITKWMDNRKVLLFQVTGMTITAEVTIRSFEWKEVGGAVGDIEFTIELKEYRPVSFTKITNKKSSKNRKGSNRTPVRKDRDKSYIVKKNDSLWKIAQKYYKSGTEWKKIYDANKKAIGKNPNNLTAGQKLVIPS